MLHTVEQAPPDAILGLTEAFKADSSPDKINLGVGIYKDAQGTTPTLACFRQAEAALLEQDLAKTYMPIGGSPAYSVAVQ